MPGELTGQSYPTPWEDLFSDEFGTMWLRKGDRTADDVKRVFQEVEDSTAPLAGLTARVIRATVGEKDGEPWLFTRDGGDEEFWEVTYAE